MPSGGRSARNPAIRPWRTACGTGHFHRLGARLLGWGRASDLGVAVGLRVRPRFVNQACEQGADGEVVNLAKPVEPDASGSVNDNKAWGPRSRYLPIVMGWVISASYASTPTGNVIRQVIRLSTIPHVEIYTDECWGYHGLPNRRAMRCGMSQWVNGQAPTDGLQSFWSLRKPGYQGTYHTMGPEHLNRCVSEFAGRVDDRGLDSIDQMKAMALGTLGKKSTYAELEG